MTNELAVPFPTSLLLFVQVSPCFALLQHTPAVSAATYLALPATSGAAEVEEAVVTEEVACTGKFPGSSL